MNGIQSVYSFCLIDSKLVKLHYEIHIKLVYIFNELVGIPILCIYYVVHEPQFDPLGLRHGVWVQSEIPDALGPRS